MIDQEKDDNEMNGMLEPEAPHEQSAIVDMDQVKLHAYIDDVAEMDDQAQEEPKIEEENV